MILTSYLYVGVHYRKNNGISSEVAVSLNIPLFFLKCTPTYK
jgi:hypothetical protein